jgi:hypothetical protein
MSDSSKGSAAVNHEWPAERVEFLKQALGLALTLESLLDEHSGPPGIKHFRIRLARAHAFAIVDELTELLIHTPFAKGLASTRGRPAAVVPLPTDHSRASIGRAKR